MSTWNKKMLRAMYGDRAPVRKRRKGGARRGDSPYRPYLEWMHTNGCLVAGRRPDSPCIGRRTVHHLRHIRHEDGTIERTGRIDIRTLTLCEGHHQTGPHAVHRMTAENGREWERFFGIDSEREVRRYNALFDNAEPECECHFTGDQSDASDCPLHGVSRPPAVRLVMEKESIDGRCPF